MIALGTRHALCFSPRVGSDRRGFTLIEVLTALVIFSVALVAFIEGMGSAISIQAELRARGRAEELAANTLEELRVNGQPKEGQDSGQFKDEDAGYAWRTVTRSTDYNNLYEVTATVSWDEGAGAKDYSLTTLIPLKQTSP